MLQSSLMDKMLVIQGRKITRRDIRLIKELMDANPSWLRTRLSKELRTLWNWRNAKGHLKNMACLTTCPIPNPLQIKLVEAKEDLDLFKCFLPSTII